MNLDVIARLKKPILVWLAIATAIFVAIHQIAIALGNGDVWHGYGLGWLTPARTTDIMVFWSLCLLLAASYLWREAHAGRDKWVAMEKALSELEVSYAKLKELEGWRDDLSHFVVHDIKHAVAGIDGSLQLLKKELGPQLSPETSRFLTCAREFAEDMLVLVSTLLDIARLESAGMPLNKILCDARTLMADAANRVKSVADLKNLKVELESAPITVICDRELIVRVIMNLLANAVRFAPEGTSVAVKVESEEHELKISVTDAGPGILPELQAHIFDKYPQSGSRDSRGASGLGLTFCRLAVEAHGGAIGVQSPVKPDDVKHPGSCFWIKIPRRT